jgi:hypothetical protein
MYSLEQRLCQKFLEGNGSEKTTSCRDVEGILLAG